VTVSVAQGNSTAIADGINPGDTVVTDGQDKLQTGSKIEFRNSAPGNSAGGANSGRALGTPAS